jgi:YD repeat-containing protein
MPKHKLFFTLWAFLLLCLIQQPQALCGRISYSYDEFGRLAAVSHDDGDFATVTAFSYDNANNRIVRDVTKTMIDKDSDLMPDGWEARNGFSSDNPADAGEDVSDGDGLTNLQEYEHGTDPNLWDTDGDGFSDGQEFASGSDPLDLSSIP